MKAAYQTAVMKLNVAPSEFWSMHPRHFWWLAEAKAPTGRRRKLTAAERDEYAGWLRGDL